jgi:hydrogenase maturation factor
MMNLVYGEVVDLQMEEGIQFGTVRISGAKKKVVLDLLNGVQCGDRVLLCDGVAIGKVEESLNEN